MISGGRVHDVAVFDGNQVRGDANIVSFLDAVRMMEQFHSTGFFKVYNSLLGNACTFIFQNSILT